MPFHFALLFSAIIGAVLAGAGAIVFGSVTDYLTRDCSGDRRRVLNAAQAFPFKCFGWAGIVFVSQAIIDVTLLGRDLPIGDYWQCQLPNGYQVTMIDVTDYGWLYGPKTPRAQFEPVNGVRLLQVESRFILGGVDSRALDDLQRQVDSYFVLDTSTGIKTSLPTYEMLRSAAFQRGIQPKLESIYKVYSRCRSSWFDVVTLLLLFGPIVGGFSLLVRQVVRLRRDVLAA